VQFKTELTKSIFNSKYLLEGETNPNQAVERVVSVVQDYYPEYAETIKQYINKRWLLPGGSIWRAARNPDQNVSVVNCTTLPQPDDNLESIFDSYYWWAKYAAFGQGEGVDISLLRPRGAKVHNSSKRSTGAISFTHIYDAVLSTIAQKGRRGASLISIHITHPDVPEFIYVKEEEGILENSNISIQVTDKFMESVLADEEWAFTFTNKYETIEKTVSAKELFGEICAHACKMGDPGLQFIDTAKRFSNSDYLGMPIISTNACLSGKEMLLTEEGYFTFKELENKEVTIKTPSGYNRAKIWSNGYKNVVRIMKKGNHNNITCTPDHKFLTIDDKIVEAQYLNGQRLKYWGKENSLFDSVWVQLGFIQGDSCLSVYNTHRRKQYELYFN